MWLIQWSKSMDALRQSMLRAQLAKPLGGGKRQGGSQKTPQARPSDIVAIDARVSALDKKLDTLIGMLRIPSDDECTSRGLVMTDIRRIVAGFFAVSDEDLNHGGRGARITRIRQIALYLCRRHTTRSLPEIGRAFQRDHSTVLHGIRRIEALRKADPELHDELSKLEKRVVEMLAQRNAVCLDSPSASSGEENMGDQDQDARAASSHS
jgi:hypothetical protein